MGRRSRKRSVAGAGPRTASVEARRRPARPLTRKARLSEAPPAPWAPLPLVELCILGGIGLVVAGLITRGARSHVEVACGLALILLASLELSIREHFAGYRSHTTLLAGAAGVGAMVLVGFLSGLPRYIDVVIGLSVFVFLWRLLRAAFQRRSGFSFRA